MSRERLIGLAIAGMALAAVMWSAPAMAQASSPAVIIGDSLTSGYFATTQPQGYAAQLQAWLSPSGYDATAQSIYGGKVADALSSLPDLEALAPDLAVIELGTNDCSGWPGTTPTGRRVARRAGGWGRHGPSPAARRGCRTRAPQVTSARGWDARWPVRHRR